MTAETPENIKPVLLEAKRAAQACGVGLTLWHQLNATGRTPTPVKLNSKTLWSTHQLEIWALNGCPSRDSVEWQQILEREQNNVD
jgi:hypothetical protein